MESADPVQPFPFASLPAVPRVAVDLGRRLRAAVAIGPLATELATTLTELAGEPVTLRVRQVGALDATRIRADAVATIFVPPDAGGLLGGVLVFGEATLAAGLVARALRQRAPRIVDGSRIAPAIAGAFAATVHAVVRRTSRVPWRVAAAGPAHALARDLAATSARLVHAQLVVGIGADTFDAGVALSIDSLPPSHALSIEELRDDATPIALPIVAASCIATRDELAMLQPGDVFLVPGLAPVGEVALVAPRSEIGLAASLAADGRLVVRRQRASRPWDRLGWSNEETANMTGMTENATLEALEDAPVVVRVELGVIELPAREWAALADGDVLTLGRKVGDLAVLRVGGVEVARGELVQVEGEYGVRIRRGETR